MSPPLPLSWNQAKAAFVGATSATDDDGQLYSALFGMIEELRKDNVPPYTRIQREAKSRARQQAVALGALGLPGAAALEAALGLELLRLTCQWVLSENPHASTHRVIAVHLAALGIAADADVAEQRLEREKALAPILKEWARSAPKSLSDQPLAALRWLPSAWRLGKRVAQRRATESASRMVPILGVAAALRAASARVDEHWQRLESLNGY